MIFGGNGIYGGYEPPQTITVTEYVNQGGSGFTGGGIIYKDRPFPTITIKMDKREKELDEGINIQVGEWIDLGKII